MKSRQEVHELVGCAMSILNDLGHGFLEKIYENALVEFTLRQIPFEQQQRFNVTYKSVVVGEFVPDLICFGQVIVDTKTVDSLTKHEFGQMVNYLKITGLEVGLLLNFKHPQLEWKRDVLSKEPRMDTNGRE